MTSVIGLNMAHTVAYIMARTSLYMARTVAYIMTRISLYMARIEQYIVTTVLQLSMGHMVNNKQTE
jgi:hypothetical protein